MISRLKHLWQNHRIALALFCATVALIGYFAVQTISSAIYWMDPKHHDQPIKPWMTPRYIAQSYDLPPFVVGSALLFEMDAPTRRVSLDDIATRNSLTLDDLQDRIDAAAAAWRADPNRENWVSK